MRRGDGELMFALFFFLLSVMAYELSYQPFTKTEVIPQVEAQKQPPVDEKMIAAGITCPECLDIPNSMERARTTVLFEGYTVEYPTSEYATLLRERCEVLNNRIGKVECTRLSGYIEEGRRFIESMVNPIYGRGDFTLNQLARVRHAAWQTMRNVRGFEHVWMETRGERFKREKSS